MCPQASNTTAVEVADTLRRGLWGHAGNVHHDAQRQCRQREQQPDGTYVCLTPEENAPLNSQEYFFDAAYAAAENNNFR